MCRRSVTKPLYIEDYRATVSKVKSSVDIIHSEDKRHDTYITDLCEEMPNWIAAGAKSRDLSTAFLRKGAIIATNNVCARRCEFFKVIWEKLALQKKKENDDLY